jgi:tetrahydromethanopterin S-methyltransferase subunit B
MVSEPPISAKTQMALLQQEVRSTTIAMGKLETTLSNRMNALDSDFKSTVRMLEERLNKNYVTKLESAPVRNLVYGAAGIILAAVFSALIYLVVRK